MSTPALTPTTPSASARRRAVLMVGSCTLVSAAAQILMKIGMTRFTLDLTAVLTNFPLIAGYALYGVFTLMMILALRDGELSLVYPIISLAYVWVTLASYFLFRDTLSPLKLLGIGSIMVGVAMLGRGAQK